MQSIVTLLKTKPKLYKDDCNLVSAVLCSTDAPDWILSHQPTNICHHHSVSLCGYVWTFQFWNPLFHEIGCLLLHSNDIQHNHVLIRFCLPAEGFADMNLVKRYRQRCFKNHLCSNKHVETDETGSSCSVCLNYYFSIVPCKSYVCFSMVNCAKLLHLSISRLCPKPYTTLPICMSEYCLRWCTILTWYLVI